MAKGPRSRVSSTHAWWSEADFTPSALAFLRLIEAPVTAAHGWEAFLAGLDRALATIRRPTRFRFGDLNLPELLSELRAKQPPANSASRPPLGQSTFYLFSRTPPGLPEPVVGRVQGALLLALVLQKGGASGSEVGYSGLVDVLGQLLDPVRSPNLVAGLQQVGEAFLPGRLADIYREAASKPTPTLFKRRELLRAADGLALMAMHDADFLEPGEPAEAYQTISDVGGASTSAKAPPPPRETPPRRMGRAGRSRTSRPTGLVAVGGIHSGRKRLGSVAFTGAPSLPPQLKPEDLWRDGQGIEDAQDLALAVVHHPPESATLSTLRGHALRRQSALRQGLLARDQWDAQSVAEVRATTRALRDAWPKIASAENLVHREVLAFIWAVIATGFGLARVHSITLKQRNTEAAVDCLDLAQGILWMPLPGDESRFSPDTSQSLRLEPTLAAVPIRLCAEAIEAFRTLEPCPDGYLFSGELKRLATSARAWIREHCADRITLARLQRAHGLEVLNGTGDVGLSQLVCGDGLATAATASLYCSPQTETTQQAYDRAIKRHGMTPGCAPLHKAEWEVVFWRRCQHDANFPNTYSAACGRRQGRPERPDAKRFACTTRR